jgi:ATP synthase protein I
MLVAVGLQCVLVAVVALGAGLWFDWTSAGFVALGGAVAIIPNSLFALRLAIHRGKNPDSYPAVFFLGEFAKIGLTIALLVLVARSIESVQWLPLLIGMIVALKAPLFAMLLHRDRQEPEVQRADPDPGRDGKR